VTAASLAVEKLAFFTDENRPYPPGNAEGSEFTQSFSMSSMASTCS
jgi:hypothetical protein